jgi:hypothetical protein
MDPAPKWTGTGSILKSTASNSGLETNFRVKKKKGHSQAGKKPVLRPKMAVGHSWRCFLSLYLLPAGDVVYDVISRVKARRGESPRFPSPYLILSPTLLVSSERAQERAASERAQESKQDSK